MTEHQVFNYDTKALSSDALGGKLTDHNHDVLIMAPLLLQGSGKSIAPFNAAPRCFLQSSRFTKGAFIMLSANPGFTTEPDQHEIKQITVWGGLYGVLIVSRLKTGHRMASKASEEVGETQTPFLKAHVAEIEELIIRERPHFFEHPQDQVRGRKGFEQHREEAVEKWEAKERNEEDVALSMIFASVFSLYCQGDAMSDMIAKTQKQGEAYGDPVLGYWVQGVTWAGNVMSSPELQTKGKAREEQPADIASEKPLNDSGVMMLDSLDQDIQQILADAKADDMVNTDQESNKFEEYIGNAIDHLETNRPDDETAVWLVAAKLLTRLHLAFATERFEEVMSGVTDSLLDRFHAYLGNVGAKAHGEQGENIDMGPPPKPAYPGIKSRDLEWNIGELVPLAEKGAKDTKFFYGPHALWAHIQLPNGDVVPKHNGKSSMGTSIKFRIYGGTQVPQIQVIQQFEAKANRGNAKPYSEAKLVFSLGPAKGSQDDQITNFTVAADDSMIVEDNRDIESDASRLHVSFDTRGGKGFGLDRDDPIFDDETKQVLTYLRSLQYLHMNPSPGTSSQEPVVTRVKFQVEFSKKHNKIRERVLENLSVFTTPMRMTWPGYKHNSGRLNIQYAQMFDRKQIKDRWAVEDVGTITIKRLDGTPIKPWTPSSWNTTSFDDTEAKDAEPKQVEPVMKPIIYDEIPQIAALPAFLDVDEGATILGYGLMNEHRLSQINCENLKKAASKVAFDVIGQGKEAMTLAHLSMKALADSETQPRLAEHQYLSIKFNAEGEEREQTVTAFSIPNSFCQPRGQIMLLVVAKPPAYFQEHGIDSSNKSANWVECTIDVPSDEDNVKREISALEELVRHPDAQGFREAFLNQNPSTVQVANTFEYLDIDFVEETKKAIILQYNLNGGQKCAFDQIFSTRNCLAICQGFPGCGKTYLLVVIAEFLVSLDKDIHVLFVTPTHKSLDRLVDMCLSHWPNSASKAVREIQIMRGQRPMHEKIRKTRKQIDGEGQEETVIENVITEKSDHDILKNIRDESRKGPKHKNITLQARVDQRLQTSLQTKETFMRRWSDDDEADTFLYDANSTSTKVSRKAAREPLVDMFEQLRNFKAKLDLEPLHQWDPKDKKHFAKADNFCKANEVSKTRVLACTSSALGGPLFKTHFASDPKAKIVTLMDEQSMQTEPQMWMVVRLKHLHKIILMYLSGDQRQLRPTIISTSGTPEFNEFRAQLRLSFFRRAIDSGFHYEQLTEKFRGH
ncbi:MAG: hypothetical protein Q9192_004743 [Flavoplaca navasiana]